jgi:hypothetical protein
MVASTDANCRRDGGDAFRVFAVDGFDETAALDRLQQVARGRWTLYVCGRAGQPDAIVAVNRSRLWADVVVLRGPDRAAAYRTLLRCGDDPLQAECVVWHFISDATTTLLAILAVESYAMHETPYAIPRECRIPEVDRRPLVIRPGR